LTDGTASRSKASVVDTARFHQQEVFTGILVPLMASALKRTADGFKAMNFPSLRQHLPGLPTAAGVMKARPVRPIKVALTASEAFLYQPH
jgi:hypothetical protein